MFPGTSGILTSIGAHQTVQSKLLGSFYYSTEILTEIMGAKAFASLRQLAGGRLLTCIHNPQLSAKYIYRHRSRHSAR